MQNLFYKWKILDFFPPNCSAFATVRSYQQCTFQALDFLKGTVDTLPKNKPISICTHFALHLAEDMIPNTGTFSEIQ